LDYINLGKTRKRGCNFSNFALISSASKKQFPITNPHVVRRLNLFWGCLPRHVPEPTDTGDMIESSARLALKTGYVSKDDVVVITSGHPVEVAGSTNMIRVKKL